MSSLAHLIIAHHQQASHMTRHTLRQRAGSAGYPSRLDELRKVGRKFTTRVEKRLRKLETHG